MMSMLKQQLTAKLSIPENATSQPSIGSESTITPKETTNPVVPLRPMPEYLSAAADITPSFVISLADAQRRVAQLQQFVSECMKSGVDYGIVPGMNKPTLLKPGAEKLCEIFGFAKGVEIIHQTEDFDRPLFAYTVKVRLVSKNAGFTEAEGVGAANSREKKFAKQDAFTIQNTLLKMAKKRALVDAVLSATRSSGLFGQDLEDLEVAPCQPESAGLAKDKIATNAAQATPTSSAALIPPAKENQIPPSAATQPMTQRQKSLILSLIQRKDINPEVIETLLMQLSGQRDGSCLTKTEASLLISKLLSA